MDAGKVTIKDYLLLHGVMLLYSVGAIFAKFASAQSFLSAGFIMYYALVLSVMMAYALLWQQTLKRFPLTTAYVNKAVVTVWGILWGKIFFGEHITVWKLIGAAIIFVGVIIVVNSDA